MRWFCFPVFLGTVSFFLLLSVPAQQRGVSKGQVLPQSAGFLDCLALFCSNIETCLGWRTAPAQANPQHFHPVTPEGLAVLGGKQGHRHIFWLLSLILGSELKWKQISLHQFLSSSRELCEDLLIQLPAERHNICNYLPIDFCPKKYLFHFILFIVMPPNTKVERTKVIFLKAFLRPDVKLLVALVS